MFPGSLSGMGNGIKLRKPPATSRRGLNSPATLIASLREAKYAAER